MSGDRGCDKEHGTAARDSAQEALYQGIGPGALAARTGNY